MAIRLCTISRPLPRAVFLLAAKNPRRPKHARVGITGLPANLQHVQLVDGDVAVVSDGAIENDFNQAAVAQQ